MYLIEPSTSIFVTTRTTGVATNVKLVLDNQPETNATNLPFNLADSFSTVQLTPGETGTVGTLLVKFFAGGSFIGFETVQISQGLAAMSFARLLNTQSTQPILQTISSLRTFVEGLIRDLLGTQIMDLKRGQAKRS